MGPTSRGREKGKGGIKRKGRGEGARTPSITNFWLRHWWGGVSLLAPQEPHFPLSVLRALAKGRSFVLQASPCEGKKFAPSPNKLRHWMIVKLNCAVVANATVAAAAASGVGLSVLTLRMRPALRSKRCHRQLRRVHHATTACP